MKIGKGIFVRFENITPDGLEGCNLPARKLSGARVGFQYNQVQYTALHSKKFRKPGIVVRTDVATGLDDFNHVMSRIEYFTRGNWNGHVHPSTEGGLLDSIDLPWFFPFRPKTIAYLTREWYEKEFKNVKIQDVFFDNLREKHIGVLAGELEGIAQIYTP